MSVCVWVCVCVGGVVWCMYEYGWVCWGRSGVCVYVGTTQRCVRTRMCVCVCVCVHLMRIMRAWIRACTSSGTTQVRTQVHVCAFNARRACVGPCLYMSVCASVFVRGCLSSFLLTHNHAHPTAPHNSNTTPHTHRSQAHSWTCKPTAWPQRLRHTIL